MLVAEGGTNSLSDIDKRIRNGGVCSLRYAFLLSAKARKFIHNPERLLADYLSLGQTAADLGCGPGFFTETMAELVGDIGKVYAVDLQLEMLEMVENRLIEAGLRDRVVLQKCDSESLGLAKQVDFALAFYVVHEVPDPCAFLKQVYAALKPGGRLLLVEPKIHVSAKAFRKTVAMAQAVGFRLSAGPPIFFSRSSLLTKAQPFPVAAAHLMDNGDTQKEN